MIAKENGFNEDYVAHVSEKSIEAAYPLTIGHRFGVPPFQIMDQPIRVAVTQRKILENFAKSGDCVIVGRGADVILKDYKPLNIFVYADKDSKVERCQRRAPAGENLTATEIEKRMKQIDRNPCPAPSDVQRQQVGRQGVLRPVRQHQPPLRQGPGTLHRQILRGLVQLPRIKRHEKMPSGSCGGAFFSILSGGGGTPTGKGVMV